MTQKTVDTLAQTLDKAGITTEENLKAFLSKLGDNGKNLYTGAARELQEKLANPNYSKEQIEQALTSGALPLVGELYEIQTAIQQDNANFKIDPAYLDSVFTMTPEQNAEPAASSGGGNAQAPAGGGTAQPPAGGGNAQTPAGGGNGSGSPAPQTGGGSGGGSAGGSGSGTTQPGDGQPGYWQLVREGYRNPGPVVEHTTSNYGLGKYVLGDASTETAQVARNLSYTSAGFVRQGFEYGKDAVEWATSNEVGQIGLMVLSGFFTFSFFRKKASQKGLMGNLFMTAVGVGAAYIATMLVDGGLQRWGTDDRPDVIAAVDTENRHAAASAAGPVLGSVTPAGQQYMDRNASGIAGTDAARLQNPTTGQVSTASLERDILFEKDFLGGAQRAAAAIPVAAQGNLEAFMLNGVMGNDHVAGGNLSSIPSAMVASVSYESVPNSPTAEAFDLNPHTLPPTASFDMDTMAPIV